MANLKEIKCLSPEVNEIKDRTAKSISMVIRSIGEAKKIDGVLLRCICEGAEEGIKNSLSNDYVNFAKNIYKNQEAYVGEKAKKLTDEEKGVLISWYSEIIGGYVNMTGNIFGSIQKACAKKGFTAEAVYKAMNDMNITVVLARRDEYEPVFISAKDENSKDYRDLRGRIEARMECMKKIGEFEIPDEVVSAFTDKATRTSVEALNNVYMKSFKEFGDEILFWNVPNKDDHINLADYTTNTLFENFKLNDERK